MTPQVEEEKPTREKDTEVSGGWGHHAKSMDHRVQKGECFQGGVAILVQLVVLKEQWGIIRIFYCAVYLTTTFHHHKSPIREVVFPAVN